jgi:hypothetical protein
MPAPGSPGPSGPGITYVMRAGDTRFHKVGFTRGSLEKRRMTLQCGCPWRLRVIRVFDGREYERHLHRLWKRWSMGGEWFELPAEMCADA